MCGRPLADDEPPDPWVGSSLGRYEIERVIASGGMGVVYAARDPQLGRTVALKVLRADLAADIDFRRRFVRESRSAAALEHPNILPVFDAGEANGVLYIATRLVDARDLRQLLADEGQLTIDRALSITAQVAAALDFAHEHGTVHRDVKPANLLVVPGRDGDPDHAYLIDFGITKRASRDNTLTASGMFVGTPEYGAPEQANGRQIDGRADQYALACVLHHCLAGSPPFTAPTAIDVLHAHLYDEPPRLGAIRPEVPASLEYSVLRALSKEPAQRFATCRAFIASARSDTGLSGPTTRPPRATIPRASRLTVTIDDPVPLPRVSPPVASPPPTPAGPPVPDRPAHSQRAPVFVVAGLVIALLAAGGAAAGALLGSDSDPRDTVGSTAETTVTSSSTRTETQPTPPSKQTSATTPRLITFSVTKLDLTERDADGYSVAFPRRWAVRHPDVDQPVSDGVVPTRTEATSVGGGLSVAVDHLEGSDVEPEQRRDNLREDNEDRLSGYEAVGSREYLLDSTTAYEYRYRYRSKAGKPARRVNVQFRLRDDDFSVLVAGYAHYESLAELARATAESVRLRSTEPEPTTEHGIAIAANNGDTPREGTYTGLAARIENGEATGNFNLSMAFGGGENGATIEYPGCKGRLKTGTSDEDGAVYTETLTDSCARPGRWHVVVESDSKLRVRWSAEDTPYRYEAELTR